jgi:nitrite reductase/ring-hydroxylating ferredoxin subunit
MLWRRPDGPRQLQDIAGRVGAYRMTDRIVVCTIGDVEEGAALKVEVGDLILAVFNLNGAFYVIDDQCTHGPGSLSEGYIEDDTVECDFHNGQFNIKTGAVVSPPCLVPVKTYKVIMDGEKVMIEMPG